MKTAISDMDNIYVKEMMEREAWEPIANAVNSIVSYRTNNPIWMIAWDNWNAITNAIIETSNE